MIAYLTKSDASDCFEQILDFLNASVIQRKVIITEDTVRQALQLDDAESIDCLPNEEIFAELARMRVVMGFFGVDTSLFEGMLVPQQVQVDIDDAAEDEDEIEALEQDKIAQALEITNLKQRVRRLEKKIKLKVSGFKRLRKVETTQRVESSADTVIDDQEDASKQGEIAELDADEDVTLEEVAAEVAKDAEDDEAEPTELKEVIEVVTITKLMIEVVTAAATTTTATPSATRRRKGAVIRDPKETATSSIIVHSEPKSKDKGKGILVEKPKPLKKQAQIEQDEAYARELEAEINANINWNKVIEQVKRKEKQDNAVLRYQALKRKPQTEAQARKNIMHFNSIVAFLEKGEDQLEEEASKALKRKSESSEQQAAKKQKLNEKVEELKTHLQIVPNNEDDVYTKATPLALKVLVVDYQIHTENNKPHYKIIRADGTHQLFLSFINLLRNFDREDLEMLWQIVQERFASSKPKNFSDDFLLNTLKAMFKKPNIEDHIWKNQRGFKIDFFKGMRYDDIRPIFEKHFNSIMAILEKGKEQLEEEAKVEELKTHLQIIPNDEDDVYTEVTPLALKVHIVDDQIHTKNNKPYYKIIRVDGTHQLFLSFISLLRNFDRKDLEMLCRKAIDQSKEFGYILYNDQAG
nr:hypothetical protein [Tanacetum cinerariifolium]